MKNETSDNCETDGECDDTESTPDSNGVDIPEDFQQHVHEMMSKASSKHHLAHIRSKLNDKEDEMRKAEMAKSKGKGAKFSLDDAPSGVGQGY